eukprot:scaffold221068_cov33-Tisochrysis_lutea.AAC.1
MATRLLPCEWQRACCHVNGKKQQHVIQQHVTGRAHAQLCDSMHRSGHSAFYRLVRGKDSVGVHWTRGCSHDFLQAPPNCALCLHPMYLQ